MNNLEIIYKNVNELIPYENNPRNNDEAIPYVVNSIKEFGFKVPIVIDKNNVIVAGHTRLKAAKELDMDTVPCIIASDLTDEQIKAFRLADNRVGEFSNWDFETLNSELMQLNINMVDFGFLEQKNEETDTDVDDFFEDVEIEGNNKNNKQTNNTANKKRIICPHCGKGIEL